MRRLIAILATLALSACSAGTTGPAPAVTRASSAASAGNAGLTILPIFVSSEILASKNRFLFSLTDRANNVIAAPNVAVSPV